MEQCIDLKWSYLDTWWIENIHMKIDTRRSIKLRLDSGRSHTARVAANIAVEDLMFSQGDPQTHMS